MELPIVGLGTWELRGDECTKTVQSALSMGYSHIDTAHVYNNHEAIAKALEGFDRSKIFITSKIALREQVDLFDLSNSVKSACESALKELKTDYLDLYLIHTPVRNYPLKEIFIEMEKLIDQGKVRRVGVSNYSIQELEEIDHPFANQVEFHPYFNQQTLLDYCHREHIKLISYRSFGKGKLLSENPLFSQIGAPYNKTGAQVILRWLIQKNIAVIPKATSLAHLEENLDVFDFSLNSNDMLTLDQMHENKRYCKYDNYT